MNDETAKAILQRNFLFCDLPEPSLHQLASLANRRTFRKGEVVFLEGDAGDALYGVISGSIRVATSNNDGKQIFLNMMEHGDVFGEISVIDGQPRTATAEAVESTSLIVIQRHDFRKLMEREPVVAIHMLQILCQRLRWTTDIVHEAMLLPAPGRIAKRLLHLVSAHGRQTDAGLELRMSQAGLASFLGVSRQIVNQNLQDWREAGLIDLRRAKMIVLDSAALEQIADNE